MDFTDFLNNNKEQLWDTCKKESSDPSLTYEIIYSDLLLHVEDLLTKIDNLNKNTKIPKEFIQYLNECLCENCIYGKVHTACYYITKDGKSTFGHAAPEIHQVVYYDFKMAYHWILLLEENIELFR